MARYDLTDEEFEILKPLLPPERPPNPGCPYRSHRQVLNGMFWILRSGAPWRDLPSRYGPWNTVYDRFRRWRNKGLWQQILDALEAQARHMDQIDFILVPSTAVWFGLTKPQRVQKKHKRHLAQS